MPKVFDPAKPCRTLDGRSARVICTDAGGLYPVVALVPRLHFPNTLCPMTFDLDGNAPPAPYGPSGKPTRWGPGVGFRPWDLENLPERHELLIPIAMNPFGKPETFHPDRFVTRPRIGHIRVTVEGARIVGAEILP